VSYGWHALSVLARRRRTRFPTEDSLENNIVFWLVVTWVVQGVINSRRTKDIQRLTSDVSRLTHLLDRSGASGTSGTP
jgi:hypothetical protein